MKFRLRGLNARVVVPGTVRRGDTVSKCANTERDAAGVQHAAANTP
jgi:MOSC domain-containing protein YiiM